MDEHEMNGWIDDAVDGVVNSPEAAVEQFTREHLPTAKKLILLWEDDKGGYNYRASHMQIFEAVAMCEITKLSLFEDAGEDDDES